MLDLPHIDPFRFGPDPFGAYAEMRGRGGIAVGPAPFPELDRAYYTFSHDLTAKALKHRSLLQAPEGAYEAVRKQIKGQKALDILTQSLLLADPPRHGGLRRPLAAPLSLNASMGIDQRLREKADELAREAGKAGRFEAVSAIATPLSFWLLQEIMGIGFDDPAAFKVKTREIGRALDLRKGPVDEASDAACQWLLSWAEGVLVRGEPRPGGLVARMLEQVEAGNWTRDDVLANIVLLVFAGQETVVDAFGNALRALHSNPEQRDRLATRSVGWYAAAQEFLRYDAPVQYAGARIAAEDLVLGGIAVRAGEAVVPVLGSANRDDLVFADGDRLELGRTAEPSLTFGMGLHVCLGQHVARIELAAMLEALFTQVPDWRLDANAARYRESILFRGLVAAPVFA